MRFFDGNGEDSLFGSYRHIAELLILICMSWAGYAVLRRMFRAYKAEFLRAGFSGVDLNKPTKPTIPEAQGVLAGAVFITIMFLFIPIPFWRYLFDTDLQRELLFKSQPGFSVYAAWSFWVASLPLLMVYLANEGVTHVVVPTFLRSLMGNTVDIGILYYIYMGLMTVFCTNSINIYAGINGLEVGQTLIIACSVALFNIIELRGYLWRVHLFSLYFLIPFIAVCWALYKVNRFPASVFVGDTFCYFAGMTLAVVGILSHFSKTLMLFFLPQIFNFIYSVPQLFALIPCPRHRLPRYNPDDDLLYPSKVCFHPKSLSVVGEFLLNWCARLKIIECRLVHAYQPPCSKSTVHNSEGDQRSSIASVSSNADDSAKEEIVEVNNFTLINLVLRICGPMSEADTTKKLLLLQIVSSCVAFFIRYPIAWLFYSVPIN
ncbi:hypothetical protein P879_05646 [Paragonimus westermani]|uniref:UDP-N-acetylglucosamine--dolichyl-phosphate N-acetylglucosaminephosphotransferase n=1 Tax=Paragonimus westermani TaxID=34504 RepID=A0A8T0D395_9TREM|nr:hypothetical protein P879_05646 [Paragonimus westermani]